jgi:hypothetical protein
MTDIRSYYRAGKETIKLGFDQSKFFRIFYPPSPIIDNSPQDSSISVTLSKGYQIQFNVNESFNGLFRGGFSLLITNKNNLVNEFIAYWVSIPSTLIAPGAIQGSPGPVRTGMATLYSAGGNPILRLAGADIDVSGFKNPIVIMGENNNSFPLAFYDISNSGSIRKARYYYINNSDFNKDPDGKVTYMIYEEGGYGF